MNKIFSIAIAIALSLCACSCGGRSQVAVVTDQQTYDHASQAIDNYIQAISTRHRQGVLLIDRWGVPDSLRSELMRRHREQRLEGAVLVGDIPIPMIRDAQHLCTAFKMAQTAAWHLSSVPSDRYYDDFDLRFDYIKTDDKDPRLFYYTLTAESAQRVDCDIYTARVMPADGPDKYDRISDFLNRAAERHRGESRSMDKVLFFAGHGYNSDSFNARIDEASALREHFPFLDGPHGRLEFINHTQDKAVARRLLSALDDPDLDIALLHHHGSPSLQYLNGSPYESTPDGWLSLARNYFRGKVRDASDKAQARAQYKSKYGIPDAWMDDADDPEMVARDSAYAESLDIHFRDIDDHCPQAPVVILDACFNGSFVKPDYIAAHYIFHPDGGTMVVRANSVNTLQDTWPDEQTGLLDLGVSAGNWAKGQMTLESHLFGDPTFAFASSDKGLNIDRMIIRKAARRSTWKRLLRSSKAELRCLAIKQLHRLGAISEDQLLDIQRQDPSAIVRLEAFNTLTFIRGESLPQAILTAMYDNYELTRRLACKFAAKSQDPSLCSALVERYMDPCCTAREIFQIRTALEGQDLTEVLREFDSRPFWKGEEMASRFRDGISRSDSIKRADFAALAAGQLALKPARSLIKAERNGCTAAVAPALSDVVADPDAPAELRITAAETLGWYCYSYRRDEILARCSELASSVTDDALRAELLKTIARLTPEK